MPLNEEELQELDTHLKQEDKTKIDLTSLSFMQPVVEKGIILKTKEQLENDIKKEKGELFTHIENRYQEITGVKKRDGEKIYDVFERSKTELTSALSTKVTELEQAIAANKKEGGTDKGVEEIARLKQEAETLRSALETAKGEITAKESEYNTKLHSYRFKALVDSALPELRGEYPKDTPKSVLADAEARRTEKFMKENQAEFDDEGNVVYKDEHGIVKRDPQTGEPLTTAQLMRKGYFSDMLVAEEGKKGGTGMKPKGQKGGPANGDAAKYVMDPNTVKNQAQLHDDLMANGFVNGTKSYMEAFNKFKGDLPLGLRG